MKRQTVIVFYLLGIYVILQFAWWGYHLIELTEELKKEPSEIAKRTIMVLGEGLVFFVILLLGLWKIRWSIRKELQLTRNQNNFLLSVTHELKTPIASNRLYLQTLLKRDPEEKTRKELLQKALEENLRLEGLIDNILNATRLEHNALHPIYEQIDLSELIRSVSKNISKRYPGSIFEVEAEPSFLISSDLFFLECIITNLVDNAYKYSGENPKVTIQLQKESYTAVLRIIDNGPGIAKSEHQRVLTKFYRSGNEETRTQKGSGLGLFIVRELVHLLKGTIKLENNSEGGSKITVILPL